MFPSRKTPSPYPTPVVVHEVPVHLSAAHTTTPYGFIAHPVPHNSACSAITSNGVPEHNASGFRRIGNQSRAMIRVWSGWIYALSHVWARNVKKNPRTTTHFQYCFNLSIIVLWLQYLIEVHFWPKRGSEGIRNTPIGLDLLGRQ